MTEMQLDTLMDQITKQYPHDPLEQLTCAVLNGQQLETIADDLVGHFVEHARAEGNTWSQIGGALGVTKQAAQKRFTPKGSQNVFARFTDDARRVILLAQEQARDLRHCEIEPDHLLLGILGLWDAASPQMDQTPPVALPGGLTAAQTRALILQGLPPAQDDLPALIPFSERCRAVLERTVTVADAEGAGAITVEHILTAMEADALWERLRVG